MSQIVRLPQLGANDEFATVDWVKMAGEYVHKGEVICLVETSKAVADLEAEVEGFLFPLVETGTQALVGQIICVIADAQEPEIEAILSAEELQTISRGERIGLEEQRRYTKKAEILAARYGINLPAIPREGLITEADIEAMVAERTRPHLRTAAVQDLVDDAYPEKRAERVLILAGGRGAVQVIDVLLKLPLQRIVGILDDDSSLQGKTVMGYPILGPISEAESMYKAGKFDAAIISISTKLAFRAQLYQELTGSGVPFTNVIDPSVSVRSNASLGAGNVILPFCHIGACAIVGNNNFLSTYVNIEHHNVLGSHCTFGPGVMTSSRVHIGDRVKFGTGVFIEPGIQIGADSIIASGCIITRDIPARSVVKARMDYAIRPREMNE